MSDKNLNFISGGSNLRLLQSLTLSAVLGCCVLLFALASGVGKQNQTATIADSLSREPLATTETNSLSVSKPRAVSESQVVSVALGVAGDTARYYEQGTGRAFTVALATHRTDVLSDKRLSGFIRSYWIPKSDGVVSAFQTSAGTEYRYYDYKTQQSAILGSSYADVAPSPNGTTLARLEPVGDDSYNLIVSGVDGANAQTMLTTRVQEPHIAWQTNNTLSLVSRRTDRNGSDLSLVDSSKALQVLLSNKENLEFTWSPDGAYLLYSFFAQDTGVSLWLRSMQTGAEAPLGIATSASKCAWHHNDLAITCGVPMKSSLTRDVPAAQTATIDDIVSFDIATNTTHRLFGGAAANLVGVTDPLVSSTDGYFLFTNMFDHRLYVFPLK